MWWNIILFTFIYTKLQRRLTQIKMTYKWEDKFTCHFPYLAGYFELFALQTDPVTELIKLRSALCCTNRCSSWVHNTQIHPLQRRCHFGAKINKSAFYLDKWLNLLVNLNQIHSIFVLYKVRWNKAIRN